MYIKYCLNCKKKFETNRSDQKCCALACTNIRKVVLRYERESGDWDKYFKHLLSKGARDKLNPDMLVDLVGKQNYKCALSGVEMTCTKKRGVRVKTNASIDRINAKEEYNVGNIQLVCKAVNSFREDMTVDEFINWCRKVTEHALCKQKKTGQERIPTATRKR